MYKRQAYSGKGRKQKLRFIPIPMLLPFLLMESKSAQKSRKKISSQASFAGRDAGYKKEKIK